MASLDDPGPALTPAEAAALHDRQEGVAWFAIPALGGVGVMAQAHTEAHDGGRLLPGHLIASTLAELHAIRTSRSAGVSISAGETRRVPFGPVVIVTPRAAKDCTNSAGVTRGRVPACMARCASAATCSCNSFT